MLEQPLLGLQVVNLSVNLPGPVAAARLHFMGAQVVKVEPPGGDPLAMFHPAWYQALSAGQTILSLNLKEAIDRNRLAELLSESDLLLTATRPAALARLSLDWESLHARFPNLCQVAITGYPSPEERRPGHDLNYQGSCGLVAPPAMPLSLLADLAGAEQAASTALALLLGRERGRGSGYAPVSLAQAAADLAQPLRYGLTVSGGLLGGGFPGYALYPACQGWIAVGTLEPHFYRKLLAELGVSEAKAAEALPRVFLEHTAEEWEAWALERDLPITVVRT